MTSVAPFLNNKNFELFEGNRKVTMLSSGPELDIETASLEELETLNSYHEELFLKELNLLGRIKERITQLKARK